MALNRLARWREQASKRCAEFEIEMLYQVAVCVAAIRRELCDRLNAMIDFGNTVLV